MKELTREKIFQFQGVEYKIEVPTVGQYLEIENLKISLSKGKWGNLIQVGTVSALRSIQIIDCIAVLKVLCPDLFQNMKVDSYEEIDAIDFLELVKIYQKEVLKWYSDWFDNFNSILLENK